VTGRSFIDELEKLGEIDLAGLSHESVMRASTQAPTFETTGLSKAMRVLDRYASMPKTAAPRVPFNPDLPQFNRVTGAKRKKKDKADAVERGKSLGGHVIGGAGAGRFIGEFAHGPKAPISQAAKAALHGKKYWGTVAGAGVGLTEFARKRLVEHLNRKKEESKEKKAMVSAGPAFSPAKAKQYASATGTLSKPLGRFGVAGPGALTRIAKHSIPHGR